MKLRIGPLLPLLLGLVLGCPPLPDFVTCEEEDACGTTQPVSTSGETPTTGDGIHTVTGDSVDGSSGSTAPDAESGADTVDTPGTTGEPALPPSIITRVVMPDYTDKNALLDVSVTADNADGVRMLLDNGDDVELTPAGPGEFIGGIEAFTGLDNGEHTAIFTPWRDVLVGESVGADYVIALPPPGFEVSWQDGAQDNEGYVAAIKVLPDGRPVEFGTYFEMGEPRCYLRLRETTGEPVELVPVLPPAYCRAIDLAIDRDTGVMHVLVEREMGDDTVWWAGEMPAWGKGPKNIGIGEVGDTALALASQPGLVAVCGSKPVATLDGRDALAVLLRPGQPAEERLFDYQPNPDKHTFVENVRDCTFAGDTLVLVGEANGKHVDNPNKKRDRLMVIEVDVAAAAEAWTVASPGPGVQSRALAVDVDDKSRYHLAGYTCLDVCEPEGEYRVYSPGGKLEWQASLGPLGSDWFGPHDIAWSPAGYVVVALGAMQNQSSVFKVQALKPGIFGPLWTFIPNDKQVPQMAFAVVIGLYGAVYAGGVGAMNHPAFAVIGS